jgi:hypothetical protein
MSKQKRDKIRETIADLINHGMSDKDIAHELLESPVLESLASEWELLDLLVGIVRDQMTEEVPDFHGIDMS